MKVAIFNGSPKKEDGTSALTASVKDMMTAEGASAEEYFLYHMGIKGCLTCGPKGGCKDDVLKQLIDEFLSSDIVVFACPILMGRLAEPVNLITDVLNSEARFNESAAEAMKGKRIALAVTIDADEKFAVDGINYMKFFCDGTGLDYRGSIVIPHADREKVTSPAYQEKIRDFVSGI